MSLPPYNRDALRNGRPGITTALFALLVLAMCATGLVGLVFSVRALLNDSRVLDDLVAHGILPASPLPDAIHDHSPERDGRSGCALVANALIRWDNHVRTASVELTGSEVRSEDSAIVVYRHGEALRCPISNAPQDAAFADLVTKRAAHPVEVRRYEPRDPRLQRLLQEP